MSQKLNAMMLMKQLFRVLGKARQGKARQGKARQGKIGLGKVR